MSNLMATTKNNPDVFISRIEKKGGDFFSLLSVVDGVVIEAMMDAGIYNLEYEAIKYSNNGDSVGIEFILSHGYELEKHITMDKIQELGVILYHIFGNYVEINWRHWDN